MRTGHPSVIFTGVSIFSCVGNSPTGVRFFVPSFPGLERLVRDSARGPTRRETRPEYGHRLEPTVRSERTGRGAVGSCTDRDRRPEVTETQSGCEERRRTKNEGGTSPVQR